ncbi:MAG: nitrate reductase [Alphaproteobacteria bacterium GWC2_42_16]|nr:MAG: nitrate reductase [Alphaproteobacteria bacterium GWC2_42_16]OFW73632.1 MAG: nitrate reductase [Alphaproteobacteria bacterium GWA2_41_27]OFW81945.1 MAG: nitrate reductase [Alphaproteobacteria bacterium RIFCSPHIGHO2_12_FULL_42_100]OFW84962.1 MAG: nitrate reductase [Alphaproteobacteria bacterium RBG_16_42_14]OFW91074.1 MAG: nitrate reductase [Alphaproteobacteria bacterium RIFCSPHIGHO2_02_FULL_42_30]OFW93554.1 MAG: nitrate reductase [Alphaproteobacteria bacterium RIFCSPHIGHO2_12_42_13]OFX
MTNDLTNKDLAPVSKNQKNWTTSNFFTLWIGLSVQIPTYMMASSLIEGGMNWIQALVTIFLGNVIVLIPMILNGHVGVKYGIPYPVFARASFGILGSNIPALLRAFVACGWFGIQTWIGGTAIYTLVLWLWPNAASVSGQVGDVGFIPFICFIAFWFMNLFFVWKGLNSIKWLETLCAPFLILGGVSLLYWAYMNADGLSKVFQTTSQFESNSAFYQYFFSALTGIVGFWATLSLNIPDFTRYAKDQNAQIYGQILGLPTTMTFFAFIGVGVTSATLAIYGEAIWDPLILIQKFDDPFIVILSVITIIFATLTTNVAANMVGPANDFSNLSPKHISFKMGGLITGILGIVMMPWKLLADPTGYIFTWLIGYSALLGPIAGIILVDYYLIRRTTLNLEALYQREGAYTYWHGYNLKAIAALILGILPNIPGFLVQIKVWSPGSAFEFFVPLYHYAWFIGLFISAITYGLMMASEKETSEEKPAFA